MSFPIPLAGLYLISAVVLILGAFTACTARMPEFLKPSVQPAAPGRVRLSGLELVLLGLLMILTSLAYGGDGRSERVYLVFLTWVGFSIVTILLRMLGRRMDRLSHPPAKSQLPA
ncbi:MAG TPA: hypothetical protein VET65_02615 [Candidatus Limnocylindrales bacterium]|nr:hypothetical protein [Candidatus Limnocylindrales bacterium]